MSGLKFTVLRGERLTWATVFRLFQLRNKGLNVSPRTHELYDMWGSLWLRWLKGHGDPHPADIQSGHVRGFLDQLRAKGKASSTVDSAFRFLKTLFRWLVRDGMLIINPVERVERPVRDRRLLKPFTEAQFKALLSVIESKSAIGVRDYALITLLADTGLRLTEALSLRLPDVDFAGCSLTVTGKGRIQRRVAFGRATRQALLAWLQRRGEAGGSDPLFINAFGQALQRIHFAHRMKQYTRKAGISDKRLGCHSLRHFYAFQALKGGMDAISLARALGHSSIAMTQRYVTQSDDDILAKSRAASPLDKMGPLPGERKRVRLR